jgi:hypothetical protein
MDLVPVSRVAAHSRGPPFNACNSWRAEEGSQSCLLAMSFVFRWLYIPGRGATIQTIAPRGWGERKVRKTLCHSVTPLRFYKSTWPCGACTLCHNPTVLIAPGSRLKARDTYEGTWNLQMGHQSLPDPAFPSLLQRRNPGKYMLSTWFILLTLRFTAIPRVGRSWLLNSNMSLRPLANLTKMRREKNPN